jgi:putative endonuclease
MKRYYVYILKCADDSLYVGITNDIWRRVDEHNEGIDPKSYTYYRRPVELVYFTSFDKIEMAIETEKRIKKWSKAKKWALINGEFELLKNLAKKKFNKT